MKYYFPLPNLPTRPVSERLQPVDWLSPGSVESCCAICSSVKPQYAYGCNNGCGSSVSSYPCSYNRKVCPINNTAYLNTNFYQY
jgi:hypothetical protein